jgi:serine/threonine-protein kinase HipA
VEQELEVHLAWRGRVVRVGRLWARARGTRETSSFEYETEWLGSADRFSLDPELPLSSGLFHSERALFNAFSDPTPDRWGQTLLRRNERARARAEGRAVRSLMAIDFLMLVNDETRLGALRLRGLGDSQFLTHDGRVPPLVQLPRLLRATNAVLADEETDEDLALLLAPGTSLGGARPKASVRDHSGRLAIAKFPARDEDWPVTRWEAATLAMADAAGIDVPKRRLEIVLRKPVLVIERFDRRGDERIPYMSALTAIAGRDGDERIRSYVEIADALRTDAASARADLAQLWRRVVFNILVTNTDDHLRNHGFLRTPGGWRLSPAFDLNPMPVDVRRRVHALAIDEIDPTSSLDVARSVIGSFGLRSSEARSIIKDAVKPIRRWRDFARDAGITNAQMNRMASAFEHSEHQAAISL